MAISGSHSVYGVVIRILRVYVADTSLTKHRAS